MPVTTSTANPTASGSQLGTVNYNPAQVMLNGGSASATAGSPYVLGAESVRATGTGPYDAAYRQNLATYAGGQYTRPGGQLNINPTSNNQQWGNPSGGGNAPNVGLPTTLLQQALGGSPVQQPAPSTAASTTSPSTAPSSAANPQTIQNWLEQYMQNGSNMGVSL
jgi:hypothetical protein